MDRFLAHDGNVSQNRVRSSSIHLRQDKTNQQIAVALDVAFKQAFTAFSEEHLGNVKKYPQIIGNLLEVGEPIYGINNDKIYVAEFMLSGFSLAIIFITAVTMTSLPLMNEKKQGLFERNIVSGATTFDIVCSFVLTQMNFVIIQVGVILVTAIELFKLHNRGSLFLVSNILFLQGICGMSLGFFISTVCNVELSAIQLILSIFFPSFAISGVLWTQLGMSTFNQKISQVLPHTLAVESIRWIMLRGKDILWYPVWPGFLTTIAWISAYTILSTIVLRVKQSY